MEAAAVLHAAGVAMSVGAVSQSIGAVAASSASAAVFSAAQLDIRHSPDHLSAALPPGGPVKDSLRSPTNVSGIQRTTSSGSSTPRESSDGWSSGVATGASTPIGARSFDSSRYHSVELPPLDPGAPAVSASDVVRRLQSPPLTGQVVAWGWGQAAAMSAAKRAPPVSLMAALWPATEACAAWCTGQDVVDIFEAWLVLLRRWPRHFRLGAATLETLTKMTIPAVVKRMPESRMQALLRALADIAQHRTDPSLSLIASRGRATPSARDLVHPVFAVALAEVAWRVADPNQAASAELVDLVLVKSSSWRWTTVPYHDPPSLAAVKEASRAALSILKNSVNAASSPTAAAAALTDI